MSGFFYKVAIILPAFFCFFLAICSAFFLSKLSIFEMSGQRLVALDGFRGFLALSVFIHHAFLWFFYLKTGNWSLPPSRFYAQLGQASVVFFFMITAFLFWLKVLNSDKKIVEWDGLFIGRLARLGPLYFVVVFVLFFVAFFVSGFELREPFTSVLNSFFKWGFFQIYGKPDLNGVSNTFTILAGVTWTLPYEWFFYLFLPIIAFVFFKNENIISVIFSLSVVILFAFSGLRLIFTLPFCIGMLAAYLYRKNFFVEFFSGKLGSFIFVIGVLCVIAFFDSPYGALPLGILAVCFYCVVCGASLFGLFRLPSSRVLGDISYSIYLLHGVFLYFYFKYFYRCCDGFSYGFPGFSDWFWIFLLVPLVVFVSGISYIYIEFPAIKSTKSFVLFYRKIIGHDSRAF